MSWLDDINKENRGELVSSEKSDSLSGSELRRGRLRSTLKGATFGWGDEGAAALVATAAKVVGDDARSWGEIYEDVKSAEQYQQDQYQNARPGEAMAFEVGGGLMTGGAAAARVPAGIAAKLPGWAQAAGVGAAGGAAYGAGEAESGSRLRGGVIGGATGAIATPIAGGALQVGGRILSSAGRSLWRAATRTDRAKAQGMVREALRQSDISPDEALSMLKELGDDGMLFEISEGTRALARALYRDTPLARTIASKTLKSRQAGAGDRIIDIVGKAAGGPKEYQSLHRSIANTMRMKAKPLYDKAYARQLDLKNAAFKKADGTLVPIDEFVNAPSSKVAINRARKLAADEFDVIDNNVKALDYIQRSLYDLAKTAKPGTNKHRVLMDNRQMVIDFLESRIPEYAAARALWRGGKAQQEAAKLGRNFMRGNQDEIVEAVVNMSDAELQAMRTGVMRSIVDTVKSTGESGSPLRKIIGKERNREIIDLVFPDGAFDKMLPKLAGEQAKFRSFSDVLHGSRTAVMEGESLIGEELMNIATTSHDVPTAIVKILKRYGFGDASDASMAELTRLLFSKPSERWIRSTMKPPPKVLAPSVSPRVAAGVAIGAGAPTVNTIND